MALFSFFLFSSFLADILLLSLSEHSIYPPLYRARRLSIIYQQDTFLFGSMSPCCVYFLVFRHSIQKHITRKTVIEFY
ncbi:hypothetical protein PILCRDRAFT_693708 [Piloderma croceum F 1598]|uniref:Secreted protein n=1 Tax=Piloderma croceum (strain F 1598) TaxID=765440 RepID=A0A0C3BBU1_PILCF|nr:hypothetical protein PILCRDRAFT_693708 [Piloderma croceum F 1598]